MKDEVMPKLSKTQQDTADNIIRIGREMGKNDTQIQSALKVAFIESSLGANKGKNPDSSASGLYQYIDSSWNKHPGDRNNDEDAIRAFYRDMQTFDNVYASHQEGMKNPDEYKKRPADMQVPANVTRDEYLYIKHHDGRSGNATTGSFDRNGDMGRGINIYNERMARPGASEVLDEAWKNRKEQQAADGKNPENIQTESPQAPAAKPQSVMEASPTMQIRADKPHIQAPRTEEDNRDITQKSGKASILDYYKTAVDEGEEFLSKFFKW